MVALARNAITAIVMLGCAASAASQDGQAANDPASLDPVRILMRMKKVYASCRSYRDSGEVRTKGFIEGGSFGSKVPFATAFVRGGPFRYQFTDEGMGDRSSAYIVWTDGGTEVRSWWDASPGVRGPVSLQEALDAASGVSGGSSLRVPGMLLPRTVGAGVLLVAPERLEDDVDRGVWCFRIRGKSRATPYERTSGSVSVTVEDETVTVWVDRSAFLLRRVEEEATLSTYRSVTTTTYTPEIDIEIPAEQLAFNPPAAQ